MLTKSNNKETSQLDFELVNYAEASMTHQFVIGKIVKFGYIYASFFFMNKQIFTIEMIELKKLC